MAGNNRGKVNPDDPNLVKIQLTPGVQLSKTTLVGQKLADIFKGAAVMSAKYLTEFKPNANQQAIRNLIYTSEVPEGLWLHVLLHGAPRSGKTYGALDYIFQCMLEYPGTTCLVVRRTVTELETAVWKDVVRFIKTYEIPTQKESIGDGIIVLANGSSFVFKSDKSLLPGAQQNSPRALGGTAFSLALVDEVDVINYETVRGIPHRMSENTGPFRKVIFYTMNPPNQHHWTDEFFFRGPYNHNDPASRIRALQCNTEGNSENLDPSYLVGLRDEYKDDPAMYRRFVLGQFAPDVKGTPMFGAGGVKAVFSRDYHVAKECFLKHWNRNYPVLRGHDFGTCNACVFVQDDQDRRQIKVFATLFQNKILYEHFLSEYVLPFSSRMFPDAEFIDYCDPTGNAKTGNAEKSYHQIMQQYGINPRYTWDASKRSLANGVNLISRLLRQQATPGVPKLLFNPEDAYLPDAMESGYCNSKTARVGEINPVDDGIYIHCMDAFRYVLVNIRHWNTLDEDDGEGSPFQVIQDSQRQGWGGSTPNGWREVGPRDGSYGRSRFS